MAPRNIFQLALVTLLTATVAAPRANAQTAAAPVPPASAAPASVATPAPAATPATVAPAASAATPTTAAAPATAAPAAAPVIAAPPPRPELAPPPIITKPAPLASASAPASAANAASANAAASANTAASASPSASTSAAASTASARSSSAAPATSGTFSSPILLGTPIIQPDESLPAAPTLLPAGDPNERLPDFDWPAMPIALAIPAIEKLTGRTIIRPATLANIPDLTLKFSAPPTRAEALQAVETLLAVNQLALIPLGDKFLKLVPLATVRLEAPPFIEGSTLSLRPSGRIATKLFQLEFLRAAEFAQQIPSMLNDQIRAFSYFERSNAILITDSISTLQRIEILIKHVDRPAATPVQAKFYTLEYAKASDLVNKFKTIFQGPLQQQLGASTTFNADDRTNQVFVIGDPRQFPFFDDLIKKLDVKSDPNTRNEVIRLRTAQAADVATLLGNIIQGQIRAAQAAASAQGGAASPTQRPAFGATGATGGSYPGASTGGSSSSRYGGSSGGSSSRYSGGTGGSSRYSSSGGSSGSSRYSSQAGGAPSGSTGGSSGSTGGSSRSSRYGGAAPAGGSTTPAFAAGGPGGGPVISGAALGLTDADQFSSYITVQPDARTNSIVVSGTVDDIRIIKDLVDKLDILLSQVRIEVVIAEVSLTDASSTGIDSLGLQISGNKLVGFSAGAAGAGLGVGATGSGGTATGLATVDRIAGKFSLSAFIGLATTPRKNNIASLSKQDLTTMHNQQASFFFGETRPVIVGSTYNDTSGNTSSSVSAQQIGTKLSVKPLIGYDGSVQLTIDLEISDVTGTVLVDNNTQYIIGLRNTSSTIIAKSGDIIVLGGIQKNSNLKTTNRLGPIPILGDLLGSRSRSKTRNELIFFLRPVVLTNTDADNAPAYKQLDNMDVIKDDVNKVLGKDTAPSAQPAQRPILSNKKS